MRGKAGNTIPMVFVTTADGSSGIEGISYDILKSDMRDANRDLRKKLETVDVVGSGSETDSEATTVEKEQEAGTVPASGLLAEAQAWSNSDGKEITAAVKSVDGENVIFVMNGREVSYPLSNLSADSRSRIEKLAAE
ncbi:MAG: hypothetical protein P1U87_00240 [Verrucomicrobiales bacterium]|nr:hypothetical protein [Verrucomicrobiales bacterium]